ncbi:MAG: hypothetical protein JST54_21120 [Deltaproteobacteria bacterium]|nr:hypothetical protein [Deltaproteobacteria bacterium]
MDDDEDALDPELPLPTVLLLLAVELEEPVLLLDEVEPEEPVLLLEALELDDELLDADELVELVELELPELELLDASDAPVEVALVLLAEVPVAVAPVVPDDEELVVVLDPHAVKLRIAATANPGRIRAPFEKGGERSGMNIVPATPDSGRSHDPRAEFHSESLFDRRRVAHHARGLAETLTWRPSSPNPPWARRPLFRSAERSQGWPLRGWMRGARDAVAWLFRRSLGRPSAW